ncbi:hypothetical protein GQ457_02G036270 [Hibiscus cannabinus]
MNMAKSTPTLMLSSVKLVQDGGSLLQDAQEYRSIVGALLYVCHTRPDIAFSVNKVAQFIHKPCETHLDAVKHVLRYLARTIDPGLVFTPSKKRSDEHSGIRQCRLGKQFKRSEVDNQLLCLYW